MASIFTMRLGSWTPVVATVCLAVGCSGEQSNKEHEAPGAHGQAGGAAGAASTTSGQDQVADSKDAGPLSAAAGAAGAHPALGGNGTYCAAATPLEGSSLRLSGSDFKGRYPDLIELSDRSCRAVEDGSSDALFEVQLLQDQELWVTENGGLDAVLSIQKSCDPSAVCELSEDQSTDPEDRTDPIVTYTAEQDETVYVVVQSYRADPSPADYEITLAIDPECGNGLLEAREACDDGNGNDSDGCSASCEVEFAHRCNLNDDQKSECAPLDVDGPFAGGDTIAPVVFGEPLEKGEVAYYVVEFSERVVVNGRASAEEGNPDLSIFDQNLDLVYFGVADSADSVEPIQELGLEPGVYMFVISADRALTGGFTITLETRSGGVCGDGSLEAVFEDCDNAGGDGCSECMIEFGWECSEESPSVCRDIEQLGTIGPGSTVLDVQDPAAQDNLYRRQWMVSFDVDLQLSGGTANAGMRSMLLDLFDANGNQAFTRQLSSGDTFDSVLVAAGTYRISAQILGSLPSGGYTLVLTTDAQE